MLYRIVASLTSMLKTSGSTKSTIKPGKGGVGIDGDGGETLFSIIKPSSSMTHQLARLRLWLSLIRLVLVVLLVVSRSKSRQKS